MEKNIKNIIASAIAVIALLPSLTSCGFTYCQHKIETIKGGNIIPINSSVGILKNEYKYKFCGLPNGVNIPPKLAAIFCIINVKAIYFSLWVVVKTK